MFARSLTVFSLHFSKQEMRVKQTAYSDTHWAIRQMFQCNIVPFLVDQPSTTAYAAFDPDTDQFKVFQWRQQVGDSIDIAKDVMLMACNAIDCDSANQLLDIALAMGAVQFVCFADEYRGRDGQRSKYTGCPVISSTKLMQCVVVADLVDAVQSKSGQVVQFRTGKFLGDGKDAVPLVLSVAPLAQVVEGSVQQKNPELPIVCQGVSLDRGHAVTITDNKEHVIWSGFYSTSKPSICTRGAGSDALVNAANAVKFGRKRWGRELSIGPPAPEAAAVVAKAPKHSKDK